MYSARPGIPVIPYRHFKLSESGEIFAIVYGPIHSLTGKSIYSSFILYTGDIVKDCYPAVEDNARFLECEQPNERGKQARP
jgi:hypothetical protein